MKKLLYICALFVLQSQAQTHSFGGIEKSAGEQVKTASSTIYYLKASGDITDLSSWGTNADGSGNTPSSFTDESTFKLSNRSGDVPLNKNWEVNNIEIGNNLSLALGESTLTINGGGIHYSGSGKIKGSPAASLVANTSQPFNLVFDNSVKGLSNGLKDLVIRIAGDKTEARPVMLLSDLHIYNRLELNSGDLVIGNNDVYLKSTAVKDAEFEAPGLSSDKANIYYDGTGRFVIERLKLDGKSVTSLIAHPFTEQFPDLDEAVKEENLIFGAGRAENETDSKAASEKDFTKNKIKDDIELFLRNRFWDLYTRPAYFDDIFC